MTTKSCARAARDEPTDSCAIAWTRSKLLLRTAPHPPAGPILDIHKRQTQTVNAEKITSDLETRGHAILKSVG
jgi:hypothetical protein